ncbi:MAG: hypothetical protein BWY69_00337 [Planctomycetes bacterium ADurb.Bin401]|nr:MAG: hypothetical protein BWY69_00337 [Planctomycetes bacterium ADurb.Bin401]
MNSPARAISENSRIASLIISTEERIIKLLCLVLFLKLLRKLSSASNFSTALSVSSRSRSLGAAAKVRFLLFKVLNRISRILWKNRPLLKGSSSKIRLSFNFSICSVKCLNGQLAKDLSLVALVIKISSAGGDSNFAVLLYSIPILTFDKSNFSQASSRSHLHFASVASSWVKLSLPSRAASSDVKSETLYRFSKSLLPKYFSSLRSLKRVFKCSIRKLGCTSDPFSSANG